MWKYNRVVFTKILFLCLYRSQIILQEYAEEVSKLRSLGRELELSEEQINQVIEESFHFLETEGNLDRIIHHPPTRSMRRMWLVRIICIMVIVSATICHRTIFVGYRKTINNYIERNVQELIYPGMKVFRKIMLPVVNQFPSLTGKAIFHMIFTFAFINLHLYYHLQFFLKFFLKALFVILT